MVLRRVMKSGCLRKRQEPLGAHQPGEGGVRATHSVKIFLNTVFLLQKEHLLIFQIENLTKERGEENKKYLNTTTH